MRLVILATLIANAIQTRILRGSILAMIGLAGINAAHATDRYSTQSLYQHCRVRDAFCSGYMEATLDFVIEYQVWLTINKYDLPPGDSLLSCISPPTAENLTTTFVAYVELHRTDVGEWADDVVRLAAAKAFPCKP